MIRKALILVCMLLLLTGAAASAQSPQINNGLAYLSNSQTPDGSWNNASSSTDTLPTTVSVIETFRLLSQTGTASYSTAVSWFKSQSLDTTDYLAERVRATIIAGTDHDVLLSYMDQTNYAWGGYAGYAVNNLDTSLVLQALKASNYSDQTVLSNSLNYLITTQNTDGGWGFYQGDDSNVYMTAMVSITLQQFPQTAALGTSINKATGYLTAHQNTDGGFGSPSSVYETSYAYIALVGVITDNTVLGNAASYITTTQSTNGSWNDDPYSTALALRAFYYSENKPSVPPGQHTGIATGRVIDAATNLPLSGVQVILQTDSSIQTVTSADGTFSLANIPQGSQRLNIVFSGYSQASINFVAVANTIVNLGDIPLAVNGGNGNIKGKVTDAGTGLPLPGVTVTLAGANTGTAITGSDGTFIFANAVPDNVMIFASKSGYYSTSRTGVLTAGGMLYFEMSLKQAPPNATTGVLVGKVLDAITRQAVQGAVAAITGGPSISTDTNGAFWLDGISPGTYQATISAAGYVSQQYQVNIKAGEAADLGFILLLPAASSTTLTGLITDSVTGQPISPADVRVKNTSISAQTAADGSYTLTGINQLQFQLSITAAGYSGKTITITTPGFGTYTANISLSTTSAPSMLITANKTVTPESVTPDGDKAINMSIQIKGLGTKPTVLYATKNQTGNVVTIAFDRPMADPSGKQAQFAVTNGGTALTITAAALNSIDPSKIDLTLQQPITGTVTALCSYTTGNVKSAGGEALLSFHNILIGNNTASVATSYDAATDFSAVHNPNGAWSYGWSTSLTSQMTIFPRALLFYGYPVIDAWDDPSIDSLGEPTVNHNRTGNVYAAGSVIWQPYQLTFHPGVRGQYTHIRWTAPVAGNITIAAEYTGVDIVGTSTDVHAIHNGVSLFSDAIKGYGNKKSFIASRTVAAGDIIDFAVGYGSNNDYHCDTTALSATITYEGQSVNSVRVIDTIPNAGVSVDQSSFSRQPYSIAADADNLIVEWRFDTFSIGQAENLTFNGTMFNPVGGEQRLVNRKVDIIFSDNNGNSTGSQLGEYYVSVKESAFQSSISTDQAIYNAKSDVTISGTVKNIGDYSRSVDARILAEDSQGNLVNEVGFIQAITLQAGEQKNLGNFTFNTAGNLSGSYRVHLVFYDQQKQVGEAFAPFNIQVNSAIASKVASNKVQYNSGEQVAITTQVQNTSSNYIYSNLTARMSVVNSQNQIMTREERGIPILVLNQLSEMKFYWSIGSNPAGTYTVKLEVLDGAAVISTSTAVFQIIGSGATGAGLSGTISAQPSPVYQGSEEVLTYTVTNKGNEDLNGINIKVLIVDPDTQAIKQTFTSQVDILQGASVSGNYTAMTANLSAKTYLIVLQAILPVTSEAKALASAFFEVKSALEITKKVGSATNLLVWLNDGCHIHRDHFDVKKEATEGDGGGQTNCNGDRNCINEDLLKRALNEGVISYFIVYDKKDFQRELRNPYYTDFLILGDQNPMEDHYPDELREQIFGGKGLISSLYLKHGESADYSSLFEIRYDGRNDGDAHKITLLKSQLSEAGTLNVIGNGISIDVNDTNRVAAWFEDNHKQHMTQCIQQKRPAIVINNYGSGKAVFYAFDLGLTLNDANYSQVSALIRNSIAYVHNSSDSGAIYAPNQIVPIELTIKSLGSAFDLRLTESYPSDIRIYDPLSGKWILDNPWISYMALEAGKTGVRRYFALTPDKAGVYSLNSEVAYKEGSSYIVYKNMTASLTVDKDTNATCDDILSALKALKLDRRQPDRAKIDQAIREITEVRLRAVNAARDAERNIQDILEAIEAVNSVTSIDMRQIRLKMDRLLESCEAEWFAMSR
jgi:hypothetical protein